jgi:ATP-dependent helicase HrpA
LKYLRRTLPVRAAAELHYRRLPAHPFRHAALQPGRELRDDLLDQLVQSVFLSETTEVRSREAFERRVTEHQGRLVAEADRIARVVDDIMTQRTVICGKLQGQGPAAAFNDIGEQLGLLIYSGFLTTTPAVRLLEMPRYLKAVLCRIDKALADPSRDQRLLNEWSVVGKPYWDQVMADRSWPDPEQDDFRWSLEEYRVSLFAQMLKTPYPVSAKRLQEAWQARKVGAIAAP